jgi:hypothetical protein
VDSGNKRQVDGHDVNGQSREDEEGSGPEAPITMRSLPVRDRIVMIRWRMRSFVRVMMVLDFSHSFRSRQPSSAIVRVLLSSMLGQKE